MEKLSLLSLLSFLCLSLLSPKSVNATGTADGMEQWGYVEVRPKAHMFWWYYKSPQRVTNSSTPWPIVMWLQGGPGASGVGIGDFLEIGPLDVDLKPRNSTWLQKADLLFVDNPVGVGYSYVEDSSLLVTSDEEAATDLTTLLQKLCSEIETLQGSTLFLIAESYGGKYAATLGVSVMKAIKAGELKLTLGGVALGDSWISPEDFVDSYVPLLMDVSRLDSIGAEEAKELAGKVKQQIAGGKWATAENTWNNMLSSIDSNSGHVDVYNFLLDAGMDAVSSPLVNFPGGIMMTSYSKYLTGKVSSTNSLADIMNGVIKQKLGIIPADIMWQEQSYDVYYALANDFMKPRINEIDELLSNGVNVTVYNGQLDVICATKGAEAWVQKLKWDGLQEFSSLKRQVFYCGSPPQVTKGFVRSYKNLHFYWILKAGHFVPIDQPCVALSMLTNITQSPVISSL